MTFDLSLTSGLGAWLRSLDDPARQRRTSRIRMSQAGKCLRQIAYDAIGHPADVPLSDATVASFTAGDMWHETLQAYLAAKLGAEIEVECSLPLGDEILIGHCDALVTDEMGRLAVWEIKSMAPYSWKLTVKGGKDTPPEGPKPEHITQASLYAKALGADIITLAYVDKATGTWATHSQDVDMQAVSHQMDDFHTVKTAIDSGYLPARVIPGYGVVDNPPDRQSKNQPWQCRYCPYQPSCAKLGPGKVSR